MDTESAAPKRLPVARVLVGIVAVVALVALGRQFGVFLDRFVEWVDGLGALGPIVFMLGYVAATVAFIPGSVLTLAAGAIFGLGQGVVYVMIGATTGASLAFLLARFVAREAIAQRVAGNPRFAAIDRAVGREGFKIVLLLRLSPVFPFNMLNYGLGLTNVRFADYVAASIGMLPGSLLYTLLRLRGRRHRALDQRDRSRPGTRLLRRGRARSGRHDRGDDHHHAHRAARRQGSDRRDRSRGRLSLPVPTWPGNRRRRLRLHNYRKA